MTEETETMKICVDCAMVHANGDTSGVPEELLPAVLEGLNRYPFLAVGDECGFSWKACDACGSTLGGDRLEATIIETNSGVTG